LTLQVEEGIYEQADLPILDKIEWGRVGEFEIKQDNRVYWVLSNKIIPPTTKKLDQIRGIVISDYQNRLDELWIMELKSKYPVKIHESAFKKSIKILEDKT